MSFASDPAASSYTSIVMTATTASDASGVEYYFACTTDSTHDSDWQDSATYEAVCLDPNSSYTFKVKASDKSGNHNENSYSTTKSATTDTQYSSSVSFRDSFETGDFTRGWTKQNNDASVSN